MFERFKMQWISLLKKKEPYGILILLPCFYPNIEIHSWPLGHPFRRQSCSRCIQVTSSVHAAQGALVAPGTACHDLGAGNCGTDPFKESHLPEGKPCKHAKCGKQPWLDLDH